MNIPDLINQTREAPIDYGLEKGLWISKFVEDRKRLDQYISTYGLRKRSALANSKIETVEDPERLIIDLGNDKQLVSWLFNRGVSDDLIIYNYQWNGNYGEEHGKGSKSEQHEAAYLAAAFPDKQLLFINQPGFGGSSELPVEISKQIAASGDFAPLGEYFAEQLQHTVKNELGHLATVGIYGESMGADRLTTYSNNFTEIADKVRLGLVDPTGSKRHSILGLAFNFLLKEGIHTMGYRQHADNIDPVSAEMRKESAKISNFLKDKVLKINSNPEVVKQKSRTFDTVKALSKDALEENLSHLSADIDRVDLYSLERSEISDNERMAAIARKLGKTALNIKHFMINGVTHAFMKGKPVISEVLIGRLFDDESN